MWRHALDSWMGDDCSQCERMRARKLRDLFSLMKDRDATHALVQAAKASTSLFEYELVLKTPDALNLGASGAMDFDLDGFIGREITCSDPARWRGPVCAGRRTVPVDHVGAGVRQINALITDAEALGRRRAPRSVQAHAAPWLHLATLTTDCKIYPEQDRCSDPGRAAGGATTFPWTSA
jgi:uncharacterized protein involved in type VI secretion and phage assembly